MACVRNSITAMTTGMVRLRLAARAAGRLLLPGIWLIALCGTSAHAADLSKDQRQWWIDSYGAVDASTDPLAARAEQIFGRVAAAADRKGNWPPKLVVIGGTGDPYALAIRDGSILLTLEGLKICYRNAPPDVGDSRLAFLIGHELAHLAKDDFWHKNAFATFNRYKNDAQVRRSLASQLEKTGGSPDFVKIQELQADSYGIMYMTMAGFDPRVIIGQDKDDFFQFWVAQIAGKRTHGDAVHVSAEARAEFVRTELQQFIGSLARFRQGIRDYRSGDYQASIHSFENFIEKYPGREVYNDLGLSHYQLAVQALSACSARQLPFKLPITLDPRTTAQRLDPSTAAEGDAPVRDEPVRADPQGTIGLVDEYLKSGGVACWANESSRAGLQEAIRFLEEAEKKDAAYLPARINLSSALILSGNYAKAISVTEEALKIDPTSRELLHNKAVAEHLFARKNTPENPDALGLVRSRPAPDAAEQENGPAALPAGSLGIGVSADMGNFTIGPSIQWWPVASAGFQASYGRGTFTTYSFRGLVRFGAVAGVTPYAGLGYLSVQREANVLGADTTFIGRGGEISAGAILPLSGRISLLAAVTANNLRIAETVSAGGRGLPVTMTWNALSVTTTFVYTIF